MDTEGFDPQKLHGAPPLMPWPKFAEWIGMGDEPVVVRSSLEKGTDLFSEKETDFIFSLQPHGLRRNGQVYDCWAACPGGRQVRSGAA